MFLLPQIHNPSKTMRKTSDELKLRYILQNTRWVLLNTVQVIKNKESQWDSEPRGGEGDGTTKCTLVFWMAEGTATTQTLRKEQAQHVWGRGWVHWGQAGEGSRWSQGQGRVLDLGCTLGSSGEYLFIYLFWSIVDLQYCVNFCCTAKWFSYIYIYIHSFFKYSFPLWFIIGYWI